MAPPDGSAPPPSGDNAKSRYEIVKEKFARLNAITEERKKLAREADGIVGELEKESGVNRGALAEIRKLHGLSAAAVAAREESRTELYDWLVKPRLEEAASGEASE